MSDLSLEMLIAVFQEIFGPTLFWLLVAASFIVGVLFIWVLLRDRGVESRRFLRSEIVAPIGAIGAIGFVLWMTKSGLNDLGGPIDLIIIIGIGLAGAIGVTILAYLVQALRRGGR